MEAVVQSNVEATVIDLQNRVQHMEEAIGHIYSQNAYCMVCYGLMNGQMTQCLNGHNLCKTCRDTGIQSEAGYFICPVCKQLSYTFTNRPLKLVLETIETFADVTCDKCSQSVKASDFIKHKTLLCLFREVKCYACRVFIKLSQYLQHIQSCANIKYIKPSTIFALTGTNQNIKAWTFDMAHSHFDTTMFLSFASMELPAFTSIPSHILVKPYVSENKLELRILYRKKSGNDQNMLDMQDFFVRLKVTSENASVAFLLRNRQRCNGHIILQEEQLFSIFKVTKWESLSFIIEVSLEAAVFNES
jgi:hypothetical protein